MGKSAGRNGAGTWGVGVVVAPDLLAAAEACQASFPAAHVQIVRSAEVAHLLVRIPLTAAGQWPPAEATLARLAASEEWVVVSVGPRPEWDDVEERRATAQWLLPVARELPLSRRVVDVDELVVFRMLAATEPALRVALVRDVLGPVLAQPGGGGRLLATLDALHWNEGSPKAAARKLGVHVKTVHGRLRQIERLTGLRLDHPPDRVRVEVALYLLRASEVGIAVGR